MSQVNPETVSKFREQVHAAQEPNPIIRGIRSVYWGYRRRDPSGWVGLLGLFLISNVMAGERAFNSIAADTARLEEERARLQLQAATLDSSMVGLQERAAAIFKRGGVGEGYRGTGFERRIRAIFEAVGSLEPGYDAALGAKLVNSAVKDLVGTREGEGQRVDRERLQ